MSKTSPPHIYALALGSNRPLSARQTPARLLDEAARLIGDLGDVLAVAPVAITRPVGPSQRLFANGALVVRSCLAPEDMLHALQRIERSLGRRRYRRWGARRLDIDIILWSGGRWNSRRLAIPHPAFRVRDFVLGPLVSIAPRWRDPVSGFSLRHLQAHLRKAA
ncbi:2-amino-4-hydroxy-6-hydroxymethyldihydropteridine diphosphokinase [Sphingobium bisphenolivorans]|uniref:2-amino-4-hydroxy-6- hydroxymethyldihydropteridine diphosphokinase n=1 Tax=Sphingobium bisphenolivorans TaxID=1335760 RepID=UPI0003A76B5D|nr:2-amino-4-hydroxy-6-hydroxymethyldihydropteridine diphosphokinase [Sphingobium bisphenolivorans]